MACSLPAFKVAMILGGQQGLNLGQFSPLVAHFGPDFPAFSRFGPMLATAFIV
jgi:hypothetical protein